MFAPASSSWIHASPITLRWLCYLHLQCFSPLAVSAPLETVGQTGNACLLSLSRAEAFQTASSQLGPPFVLVMGTCKQRTGARGTLLAHWL